MKNPSLRTTFLTASAVATLALAPALAHAQTTSQAAGQAAPAAANPLQGASPAQLQREHNRAVKAGDTANDPMNPASSNALNQAQLQGTPLPDGTTADAGGPAAAPPDASAPPPPASTMSSPANPPAGTDSGANGGMNTGTTPQ
ncbi:hypothetical protein [Asticcacaulis sp. EMRT-3]|uniref:hypothetical protein n=1 Tax=Asticcacaulis sp. EMRT-3 TaxID=3040349 RepID=UPI0024AEDB29|nr:hypothetical protein [Asticcacaulis sp. EMRT-3]MDI7774067.1 hypothetical protein [Asticcacaulis sp. EMRT-3]